MGVYILVSTHNLKRCDFDFYNINTFRKVAFLKILKHYKKFKFFKISEIASFRDFSIYR